MKQHLSYIDLGAGMMILWMMMGHAISAASLSEIVLYDMLDVTQVTTLPEGLHATIGAGGRVQFIGIDYFIPPVLFFFMQWFFYKSGQFFSKRPVKDEWKRDRHKLLRQFIIWSAIGYAIYVGLLGVSGGITLRKISYSVIRGFLLNGYIPLNYPLWFLFTLFIVRQIANVILPNRDDKYYGWKCALIVLISCSVAFFSYLYKPRLLPLWVANGGAGIAFFTLGYCLHQYEMKWWLIVPSLLVVAACCIWHIPDVGMLTNSSKSAITYLLNIPACIAGIVLFNDLCRLVANHLHYLSLPFEYIGKYAMIIYVSHGLFSEGIPTLLASFDLKYLMSFNATFFLVIGSYILFVPLFCYIYKRTNQKKIYNEQVNCSNALLDAEL